jgi:hypothetical protein
MVVSSWTGKLSFLLLFLQFGNFRLNIFPHMAMKLKLQFAEPACENRSFEQAFQRIFVLPAAQRTGYRQLFFMHGNFRVRRHNLTISRIDLIFNKNVWANFSAGIE